MLSVNIELDAHHNELRCALVEIAARRGLDEPDERADDSKRKILRAIRRAENEKLNAWRHQRFKEESWKKVPLKPTVRWAIILVRGATNEHPSLKLSVQPRLNREEAIKNATSITYLDLTRIERRAVEILCGSRPKSKKNVVETKAISLANAVRRDWFSAKRSAGRPRGANSRNGIKIRGHSYQVPLSMAEVIATVRPLIDDLVGAANNRGRIPGFRALVAAVQIAIPGASRDSIARIATRVKAGGRELEKPLAV